MKALSPPTKYRDTLLPQFSIRFRNRWQRPESAFVSLFKRMGEPAPCTCCGHKYQIHSIQNI